MEKTRRHDETRNQQSNADAPVRAGRSPLVPEGPIQREADGNGVQPHAETAVAEAGSSSGSELPAVLRRKFEGSLGADLSGVRIHSGAESHDAAAAVGARAYTLGQDIHFGRGQLDASSEAGQHLLAHEVAHTVQQAGGAARKPMFKLDVSTPGDSHEVEADRSADAMVRGEPATVRGASGVSRKMMRKQANGPAPQASQSAPSSAAPAGATPSRGAPAGGGDLEAAVVARTNQLHQKHALQQTLAQGALSAPASGGGAQHQAGAQPAKAAAASPAPQGKGPPKVGQQPPAPPAPKARLQRLASGGAPVTPEQANQTAKTAVSTPGQGLPYADTLQKSFGHHDLSSVVSHVGGEATALTERVGALAFATGDHLVFKGAPDLHTVAHEAAHVVQQRGGAAPKDGIGEPGDSYERKADQVADAVVRGDSAEPLLGDQGGSAAANAPVQFLFSNTTVPSSAVAQQNAAWLKAEAVPQDAKPYDYDEPFTQFNGCNMQFFEHAKGAIDTGPMLDYNQARLKFNLTLLNHESAIDDAMADDKAKGVKLDGNLTDKIRDRRKECDETTALVGQQGDLRNQCDQITDNIAGIIGAHDAAVKKDKATADASEDQAKVAEASAEAAELQKGMAGVLVEITVSVAHPVEAAGALFGFIAELGVGAVAKDQAEQAKAACTAKWSKIISAIDAQTAAEITKQCKAQQGVILALQSQAKHINDQIAAKLKRIKEYEDDIMKAKSPVTALAAIQDYITAVGGSASELIGKLGPVRKMLDWDYQNSGNELNVYVQTCRARAMGRLNGFFVSDKESFDSEDAAELEAAGPIQYESNRKAFPRPTRWTDQYMSWLDQTSALIAWIGQTQGFYASAAADMKAEEAYLSGPHMDAANRALAEIAHLD